MFYTEQYNYYQITSMLQDLDLMSSGVFIYAHKNTENVLIAVAPRDRLQSTKCQLLIFDMKFR